MGFVPLAALAALVYTIINFFKFMRGGDWNSVATIAAALVAGVLAVCGYANSDFVIPVMESLNLADLNLVSQILVGVNIGALAATGAQLFKVFDNTQSASTPALTKLSSGE